MKAEYRKGTGYMPNFKYTARTADGKKTRGVMSAADETELYIKLRDQKLYLKDAVPEDKTKRIRPIKSRALSEFSRQLGTLLGSGVSLVRALNIISQDNTIKPQEREIYEEVLKLIRQGIPMSEAMEEQAGAFPELFINMYRAAESSGSMDKTALRMADLYDKQYRLNAKVKNSLLYPKILGVVIVLAVAIIFKFVMPEFQELFDTMDDLPGLTKFMMSVTDIVENQWVFLLIGVIMLVLIFSAIFSIPSVALRIDRIKVHFPLFGKLMRTIYTARFARTLSSLYSAGLPIVMALQISRKTIGNKYIELQFDQAIDVVRRGDNLSEAISGIDGLSNKITSSIKVGEETGSLDTMLETIADSLDYESEMATSKMTTMMEPIIIILMAVIVLVIMLSVLIPIFNSYGAVESTGNTY